MPPFDDLLTLGLVQATPDPVRFPDPDRVVEAALHDRACATYLLGDPLPGDALVFALRARRREEHDRVRASTCCSGFATFLHRDSRSRPLLVWPHGTLSAGHSAAPTCSGTPSTYVPHGRRSTVHLIGATSADLHKLSGPARRDPTAAPTVLTRGSCDDLAGREAAASGR